MAQDFPRRGVPAIDAFLFALGFGAQFRHPAGPVKVQIRIEVRALELVEGFGMLGSDMAPAHVFADHPSVFGLGQGVVALQLGECEQVELN